jgi:hypothetical protein
MQGPKKGHLMPSARRSNSFEKSPAGHVIPRELVLHICRDSLSQALNFCNPARSKDQGTAKDLNSRLFSKMGIILKLSQFLRFLTDREIFLHP